MLWYLICILHEFPEEFAVFRKLSGGLKGVSELFARVRKNFGGKRNKKAILPKTRGRASGKGKGFSGEKKEINGKELMLSFHLMNMILLIYDFYGVFFGMVV